MKGFIYIASAFESLTSTGCKKDNQIDNDPHIWSKPYTWGICRPDLRERVKKGDYVFYVLGANAKLPQMIFAYFKVQEIISHVDAYFRPTLISKRMADRRINGNIIVDYFGNYNIYDKNYHRDNFDRIKKRYAVADMSNSRVFSKKEIIKKAPEFVKLLNNIFNKSGNKPIDIISKAGIQYISKSKVDKILNWLNNNLQNNLNQ